MKRLFTLALLLLLSLGGPVWGQSKVWQADNIVCDTAIVRHWHGEEYIVYSRIGGSGGRFVYHDNASNTVVTVDVPSAAIINDFRIANDTVFAGGSYLSGSAKSGLLACFAINELLAGNVTFNAFLLPQVNMQYIRCRVDNIDRVVGVTRIALYSDGGGTRVAYIADNHIDPITPTLPTTYYRVGYGDAGFVAPGVWDVCAYHFNKDGIEEYTDICATDNKIVITARSNDSLRVKLQVFDKARDFATSLPSTYYSDRYGFTDHEVKGKVIAAHMGGDTVALAYHYDDGSSVGLAVKAINVAGAAPQLIESIELPETEVNGPEWCMNDMRFEPTTGRLMIMCRMDDALYGTNSYIYSAGLLDLPAATFVKKYCPLSKRLHSIDVFDISGFVAAGHDSFGEMQTYVEKFAHSESCGKETKVSGRISMPLMNMTSRHHCTIYDPPAFPMSSTPQTFTASYDNIDTKCAY